MIKFDKLFQTLKKNDISQYNLYTYRDVSRAQIQRLKKNQSVEFIPDSQQQKEE